MNTSIEGVKFKKEPFIEIRTASNAKFFITRSAHGAKPHVAASRGTRLLSYAPSEAFLVSLEQL